MDPLDWSQAERKFRKRTLIGIAVCAVLALIWAAVAYFARNVLPAWLTAPVGFIAVGTLAVVFLLWSLYAFFRGYSAFLERGRRRLEVRRRWLERAQVAMREHARLRIARVLMTKWLDILAAIYPPSDTTVEVSRQDHARDSAEGHGDRAPHLQRPRDHEVAHRRGR